jgi:hypothetical protein
MASAASATRRELAQDIGKDLGQFTTDLVKNLRASTPKRSGRAAAGWTATTRPGSDNYNTVVTQNTVPYIQRLNEGYSRQAPAGYVQKTIDDTLRKSNK